MFIFNRSLKHAFDQVLRAHAIDYPMTLNYQWSASMMNSKIDKNCTYLSNTVSWTCFFLLYIKALDLLMCIIYLTICPENDINQHFRHIQWARCLWSIRSPWHYVFESYLNIGQITRKLVLLRLACSLTRERLRTTKC